MSLRAGGNITILYIIDPKLWIRSFPSHYISIHTVDGKYPAPPGMYKNPTNNGINYLSTGAGFLPSTVSCDYWTTRLCNPTLFVLPSFDTRNYIEKADAVAARQISKFPNSPENPRVLLVEGCEWLWILYLYPGILEATNKGKHLSFCFWNWYTS